MRYIKKPITVEAVQWNGRNRKAVEQLFPEAGFDEHTNSYLMPTLEGVMEAKIGDYIIRGVEGEVYPCKPLIFRKTYERCPK